MKRGGFSQLEFEFPHRVISGVLFCLPLSQQRGRTFSCSSVPLLQPQVCIARHHDWQRLFLLCGLKMLLQITVTSLKSFSRDRAGLKLSRQIALHSNTENQQKICSGYNLGLFALCHYFLDICLLFVASFLWSCNISSFTSF